MKMRPIGGGPNPVAGVLVRKGDLDADIHKGKRPCEDRGRNWRDATISPGTSRIAGNHQKQGRALP